MYHEDKDAISDVGKKLEQLRLNQDLSQNDVAEQIGVARKTLSTIENGGNFTLHILIKLLRLYGKLEDFGNILSLPKGFDMDAFNTELKKSKKRYGTRAKTTA